MIDTKLGPYEIREEVGRGGMATVYRAYQPNIDRDVAVKVILKGIAGDTNAIQRFQREARLVARLEHPHILPVYDFDGAHDPPYIVMRYMDSGTLRDVMAQGLLPHDAIAYLIRQVCSALDYAHRQGIVHRDIKPSNIMIDREGNAFVTDLGIARITAEAGTKQITETGAIIGTPDYMSPEQAMGADNLDHRTDIYALGVMVFQMLTGELPFSADSTMGTLMLHVHQPPPFVVSIRPELPEAVDVVIQKALAKDRNERYGSAAELAAALTAALGGSVVASSVYLREMASTTMIRRLRGEKVDTDSKSTPAEQQKQVTVLYANLAEFMEMAEAEAQDAAETRSFLWAQVDAIIQEYGGAIDNHTGDTVLALWGVKSVSEDDPERAIKAALALQAAVREASMEWLSEDDTLPAQIGIHTGTTLLKRDETTSTYTASGTTVNMATRLEQAAPAGGILISSETYNYVRGVFLVEGLEPVRFRGSKEAVQVYLIKAVKPRAFRQERPSIEGVETKTVGRDAEMRQLMDAMETAAEDTETQVVTIIGEAGVGKSRLLFEVADWEEKREGDFWYFPAHSRPQMQNQPFALLRELFAYRFEVLDSDDIGTVQDKFERGVAQFIGEHSEEAAHVIAYLLGFNFPDSPHLQNRDPAQLNAQGQKHITTFFEAAVNTRQGVGANRTLGVWIELENIHWADDRSLDYVNQLVEDHPHWPLVVICTARPTLYDRRPTWGSGQDFHQRLELRPLSKREGRKLVREILQKVPELADELRDLIAERSEGNPFYMEELVKMLIDDRVIIKGAETWAVELERLAQARVPVTLTGLLQARLDSLLAEERITLQRAAVIGRVFWDSAVRTLGAADSASVDVGHTFDVLTRRELILPREETAFAGTKEYIFKSTMLRDVTYESILKRQQRNYHFEAGNWLVSAAGGRVNDYAAQIAEHFEIAGENVLAARYLYQVGEQAQKVSAYAEALRQFQRGLALVNSQVDAEAKRLQADIYYQLGSISVEQGDYTQADIHFQDSIRLGRELGNQNQVADALGGWGNSLSRQGKLDEAIEVLEEAVILGREIGNARALAFALIWLGGAMGFRFQYERAEQVLKEAQVLAHNSGQLALEARTLNVLGENARFQNKYAEASIYYDAARTIYVQIGSQFGIAIATLNQAHLMAATSDEDTARKTYSEAIRIGGEIQAMPIVLEALAGLAGLEAASGKAEYAAELLGLIIAHPACDEDTRKVAKPLLEGLGKQLKPAVVEAALERGKKRNLDTVMQQILVT